VNTITVDGQMCEAIRIGVAIQAELSRLPVMWRRKPDGVPMTFSSYVLNQAGGLARLLTEWEAVDHDTYQPVNWTELRP